jgi:hypothetical protein
MLIWLIFGAMLEKTPYSKKFITFYEAIPPLLLAAILSLFQAVFKVIKMMFRDNLAMVVSCSVR